MKRNRAVSELDHRQLGRDSLFLMADLRLERSTDEHRVKVRNLSAGGMMAEGHVKVMRGSKVEVNLRNIGWVEGVVAWIQDNRFGIAFSEDIDPKLARANVAPVVDDATPRFVKVPIKQVDPTRVRKI
ncbi:PilZ domain-containing protein [Novosphingobium cyanobacteriorum]|uniref:PilZ domain-containing protein n=1 Tax=Novosphingobium cyanobacteriorum TaxID=3024215 RepID=A0ABT6CIJ5_9SPHN|nr:PilZ domain-containing protein [Novosphingobium cyanobacteriorum]MDF8333642.1 PilZ domain-containing protein [Novosphingobium cyanobacteriorum]